MSYWDRMAIGERVADAIRSIRSVDPDARSVRVLDRAIRRVATERGLRFAEVEACVELAS